MPKRKPIERQMEDMFPETVKGYAIHQAPLVNDKFRELFGVTFKKFHDVMMTAICKKIILDILAFDDYLHERFGQYEDEGKSMKDIVREKFGEEAENLVSNLIG